MTYTLGGADTYDYLGDPHRLKQILLNLVNNAVKFTQEGKVEVRVRVQPTPANDRDQVYFEIVRYRHRDRPQQAGPPLPAFLAGGFLHDAQIRRQPGLGLVICKRLVEKMSGDIRVTSQEGQGSTFAFDFPLTRTGDPVPTRVTMGSTQLTEGFAQDHPLSILVVEDDAVNRQLAQEVMSKLGYTVDLAEDEPQASRLLRQHDYDIVLMDIQLPGRSGLEITRRPARRRVR